ncbi:MAG: flagellar biosynthetic protein FliO [Proteobacteria bacterium]|nr:flagellar biosynthetic protein FliO [Pseudomonadota bacterium]
MIETAPTNGLPGGYGEFLLTSLLVLALVCILAWAAVRFGTNRLRTMARAGQFGPIRIVARAPLEFGHTLYVAEVAGKVVLLATGESGVNLLAELDSHAVDSALAGAAESPARGFAALVCGALGRPLRARHTCQPATDQPLEGTGRDSRQVRSD